MGQEMVGRKLAGTEKRVHVQVRVERRLQLSLRCAYEEEERVRNILRQRARWVKVDHHQL